jgi:phage tail protein X
MTVYYYRTSDRDMLDLISFSHYGNEHGVVQIMQANPTLSLSDLSLEAGILIKLPELSLRQEPVVSLWD